MKFKVLKTFSYHGKEYEEGDIVDFIDHVANSLCTRGYGKKDYKEEKEYKSSYDFVSKKDKKKKKKEKNY